MKFRQLIEPPFVNSISCLNPLFMGDFDKKRILRQKSCKIQTCTPTETTYEPIYNGFKKLYNLKPILEEAGLYPILPAV